jgi:ferritin-like metal-binding protein YciE
MAIKNPKELFVRLLSGIRQGTEQGAKLYNEISHLAEDPEIKEVLEARAFISEKGISTIDQCFKVIGERPVKVGTQVQDAFVDEFREEFAEIEDPATRRFYLLARANQLNQLRVAEYGSLVAAADISGHSGVGVLLSSCLADRLAFGERVHRIVRQIAETKMGRKVAERVAA